MSRGIRGALASMQTFHSLAPLYASWVLLHAVMLVVLVSGPQEYPYQAFDRDVTIHPTTVHAVAHVAALFVYGALWYLHERVLHEVIPANGRNTLGIAVPVLAGTPALLGLLATQGVDLIYVWAVCGALWAQSWVLADAGALLAAACGLCTLWGALAGLAAPPERLGLGLLGVAALLPLGVVLARRGLSRRAAIEEAKEGNAAREDFTDTLDLEIRENTHTYAAEVLLHLTYNVFVCGASVYGLLLLQDP